MKFWKLFRNGLRFFSLRYSFIYLKVIVCWHWPAADPVSLLLCSRTGCRENRRKRRLVIWDKGSWIEKAEPASISKAKRGIHSLLLIDSLWEVVVWEDKHYLWTYFFSPAFPELLLLRRTLYVMEYPFGQTESVFSAMSPPNSCPSSAYSLWGQSGKKALMLSKNCSVTVETLVCYKCCFKYKCKAQHYMGC